jgi:hypothetical protein
LEVDVACDEAGCVCVEVDFVDWLTEEVDELGDVVVIVLWVELLIAVSIQTLSL